MNFLRNLWLIFVHAVCSLGRISLLLLWGLLLAALYVQIQFATLDGLVLPDFAKSALQDHLAARGIRVDFSRVRFDTAGRILIEDVSLGDPKIPGALVKARSVSTSVNPWLLLLGEFNLPELQVNDASLFRPVESFTDPFGPPSSTFTAVRNVADHINFTLHLSHHDVLLPQLTAQVGVVAVNAQGALRLPQSEAPLDLKALLATTESLAIELSFWDDGGHLLEPRVGIVLTPANNQIAVAAVVVDSNGYPDKSLSVENGAGLLQCGPLHLTTSVPLVAPESDPVEISGYVEHPALPKEGYDADGRVHFRLRGDLRRPPPPADSFPGPYPTWFRLDAALNSITSHAYHFSTGPVAATISLDRGLISAGASVQLAGSPWSVKAEVAAIGSGQIDTVTIGGPVDNGMLALAGKLTGHDLGSLVQLDGPARLVAKVTFSDEGKFSHAEGRIDVGAAHVAGVSLDAAAGQFKYDGTHLVCDDVFLQTGANVAKGSYEMDTSSLDYRFLLAGHAHPAVIAGWFGDWWPALWKNVAFNAPPEADVDVQGRWGAPALTSVFVAANATGAALRGTAFDEIRARVFVRPGWEDVLSFSATQGARGVQGAGTLAWENEGNLLRAVGFDLTTNLDPDRMAGVLGPDGGALVAPYHFTQPPTLMLNGRLEGETTAGWAHTTFDIGLKSQGELTYYGFPLRDLEAQARVRDDTVELPSVAFGFAGGVVGGSARVWTENGPGRRLSFNARLAGANLGESIQTLENFSAVRQGLPAPAASQFQQRLATGRLDLTLTAEGAPTLPLLLHGQGHAEITGADLGQVQLFGLLSDLLNHTLLNFSSLALDTLQADFALDGEKISFPGPLTLSGPRARLDATGNYQLDSKQLDFKVKIQPFEENRTLLGDVVKVVIKPLETAMEVKLQGTLEKPDWVFVLGPTSLLRKITGALEPNPADQK